MAMETTPVIAAQMAPGMAMEMAPNTSSFDWVFFLEIITYVVVAILTITALVYGFILLDVNVALALLVILIAAVFILAYFSLVKVIIGIARDVREIKNKGK